MVAHNRIPGGLLSVLLAGPIFLAALAIAIAAQQMPGPVSFTSNDVASYAFIMLFSILVGGALALLPVVLGSFLLSALGNRQPLFRHPFAWTLAGAAIGGALGLLWGTGVDAWPAWFAMTITGAACARLARCWVKWTPADQPRNALTPAVAINACPPK